MHTTQRDALRAYLADAYQVPVIWAYQPGRNRHLPDPPQRPYIAIIPGLDIAAGRVERGPLGPHGARAIFQIREITMTFRVMADTDWQARDMIRRLDLILAREAAILLFDEHGLGLMRGEGIVDNSVVRDASWVGRADQDLIFSYAIAEHDHITSIEKATFSMDIYQPESEFQVEIEEEP